MQELAKHYPQAVKIRLVQDNLNTHDASAFYEKLAGGEGEGNAIIIVQIGL